MLEHRYADNAEAAPAQGGNHLLKRLRQRKTTQTQKTRFNSAPHRRRNSRKPDVRSSSRCVRAGENSLVCANRYAGSMRGEQTGQKVNRRRNKHKRALKALRPGGSASEYVTGGWMYRERTVDR